MSNRRSFLKMLFGGIAAASATPANALVIPKIFPAGSTITVDLGRPEFIYRPHVYIKEFDLDTDIRSLILNVAPNFAMDRLCLRFYPEVKHKSLTDFFENVWVDLSVEKDVILESPAYMLDFSGISSTRFRLDPLVIVNNQLTVNMKAAEDWKSLPGIKGQLIVQGLQRYSLNHF